MSPHGGPTVGRNPRTNLNGFNRSEVRELDGRLVAGSVHPEKVSVRPLGLDGLVEVAAHVSPRPVLDVAGAFDLLVMPAISQRGPGKAREGILVGAHH